ncbi:triose-phosphate isomerase [Candidatus Saccharibacteria bacterium]|nr:triose-phosphate isomerase [Candidatus Saccharibacteria bacterium]MBH1972392.1 triose-phosphate isomerase [Candidatus Saccharibacteria bacterium]MBH1990266.1 triose-phosphate isomerase [Candidatus Saccharibacteria bacterium]OGL23693.1 MAG: triose-phosphate isomerase [Candidatus Saccharibacteria bacterium RIFCSPHIGHO2_01_FULL_46_30]
MTRRKKIIAGNWKMNFNIQEASIFLHNLEKEVAVHRDVEVVLAPTMLALQPLSLQVNRRQFKLAAQNFHFQDYGAFTGEVSATQLRGLVEYGIVGHSERRHIFRETDKMIRSKVQAAIRNRIRPILCIGETAQQKSEGETADVIHDQLVGGLANVTSDELKDIVIAYEPVWAIGTGNNALPSDVKRAIKAIRSQIRHLYGAAAAEEIQVLYGGSVKPDSATAYLQVEGVDGLLVGGASLSVHDFAAIAAKAHGLSEDE